MKTFHNIFQQLYQSYPQWWELERGSKKPCHCRQWWDHRYQLKSFQKVPHFGRTRWKKQAWHWNLSFLLGQLLQLSYKQEKSFWMHYLEYFILHTLNTNVFINLSLDLVDIMLNSQHWILHFLHWMTWFWLIHHHYQSYLQLKEQLLRNMGIFWTMRSTRAWLCLCKQIKAERFCNKTNVEKVL